MQHPEQDAVTACAQVARCSLPNLARGVRADNCTEGRLRCQWPKNSRAAGTREDSMAPPSLVRCGGYSAVYVISIRWIRRQDKARMAMVRPSKPRTAIS